MTTEVLPRRDWLNIGRKYTVEHGEEIERQIDGLEWTSERSAGMMPALAINACIEQLRIPKVTAYATNGYLRVPDGPEESAHYSIYGIEGNYANGRVRLYVLDCGSELVPLCADVFPPG